MRVKVEGYAHTFATFRFVMAIFLFLIACVTLGQFWTYHIVNGKAEENRKTLCSLVGIFVLQPRTDLTPEQQEMREATFRRLDDLISCGFSDQQLNNQGRG